MRTFAAYKLVRKDYLRDLEHKAECLRVLTMAFDGLPKEAALPVSRMENARWLQ